MPIEALAQELLRREMAKDPEQFKAPVAEVRQAEGMSPDLLHTLGGLADTASTYAFAKTGRGREDNPALNWTKGNPEALALGSLAGLLTTKLATKMLKKVSPRFADAVAANLGAEQMALAVSNTNIAAGRKPGSAFRQYKDTMLRHQMSQTDK